MRAFVLAATLVLFVAKVGDALQCHEGFNVSISGLPFYYWAEHNCADRSECFMQEVSFSVMETIESDFVLRFGGCISESLAPYMACERLYGKNSDATVDIVFDMFRGLDDRIDKFAFDLAVNRKTHLLRFFSRGRDLNEFISGALEFLDSMGYDRSKIEHHFRALVMSIRDGDGSLPLNILSLAEAAKVRNEATERLSRALCRFIKRSTGGSLTTGLQGYCYMSPGLAYPLISRYDPSKADEIYIIMATGLENSELDGKQASVPESHQAMFFLLLHSVLLTISDMQPETGQQAYEVTKSILKTYKLQGSSKVRDADFQLLEIIITHNKEIKSLPSCHPGDVSCQLTNMEKKSYIIAARNSEILLVLFQLSAFDGLGKEELVNEIQRGTGLYTFDHFGKEEIGNELQQGTESYAFDHPGKKEIGDELQQETDLIRNMTLRFIHVWEKWSKQQIKGIPMTKRTPLTDLSDLMQPEMEKLMQELGEEKNGFLKGVLLPDACYHFACSTNLCNSHSAFPSVKTGRRTKKDEL